MTLKFKNTDSHEWLRMIRLFVVVFLYSSSETGWQKHEGEEGWQPATIEGKKKVGSVDNKKKKSATNRLKGKHRHTSEQERKEGSEDTLAPPARLTLLNWVALEKP